MSENKSETVSSVDNQIAFMIVGHNPDIDKDKFFGGFYNEADHIGAEEGYMCWGLEMWVDLPNDAQKFSTFAEAKDWLKVIDKEHRDSCSIVLYGRGVCRLPNGSYWYPLKVFLSP